MTRISRDEPNLDMKRGQRIKQKKHKTGTNHLTQVDSSLEPSRSGSSGSSASVTGSTVGTAWIGTERRPSVSNWRTARSSLSRLPEISASLNGIGGRSDIIDATHRPRLQRSNTGGSLSRLSDIKRHSFKQLTLQSIKELNENLLTRRKDLITSLQGHPDSVNSILERNYHNDYDGLEPNLGYVPHTPYFSKWKISGFKHDKVILTSLTTMSETQEVTPEFVQYIKERDAAVEDAKKAQAELRETQSKLYDSILLTEELEKKLKELEANQKSSKTTGKKSTSQTTMKKKTSDATAKGRRMSVKSVVSSEGTSRRTSCVSSARAADGGLYHPPVKDLEPVADSREYYWKLAEKFPTLPMFQILDAEKKFIKADTDNSGYIDIEELDKVLSDNVGLFTPAQLDTIFKEVDLDNSETLDFHEVLFVINKLFSRRKTNLPQSVQQNYSKTCNVQ